MQNRGPTRFFFAVLLSFVAGQAPAQGAMDGLVCDRALVNFLAGLTAFDPQADFGDFGRHIINGDGWCELNPEDNSDTRYLTWRASDLAANTAEGRWPERVEFRLPLRDLTGSEPGKTVTAIHGQLLYDSEEQALLLTYAFDFAGDHSAMGSLQMVGFNGSSAPSMRLSVGSLKITEFSATVVAEGPGTDALWAQMLSATAAGGAPDPAKVAETQALVTELLRVLPTEVLTSQNQEQVAAFFAGWPEAGGELSVNLTSEVGVGIFQMAGSLGRINSWTRNLEPRRDTEDFVRSLLLPAVEVLLHGVDAQITWQPS